MSSGLTRLTLSEQLADELIEIIVLEGLRPNDKLPSEAMLAARFGVSRPIVREAMRALGALGVIATASGKEAVVRSTNPKLLSIFFRWAVHSEGATLAHVMELRRGIELQTAELAALHRTDEDVARLRALVAEMRKALDEGDIDRHLDLDLEFHLGVAHASGNPLLEYLLTSLRSITAAAIHEAQELADNAQTEVDQATHLAVLMAVTRGGVVQARRAMAKHFDDALARTAGAPARVRETSKGAAGHDSQSPGGSPLQAKVRATGTRRVAAARAHQ